MVWNSVYFGATVTCAKFQLSVHLPFHAATLARSVVGGRGNHSSRRHFLRAGIMLTEFPT
eukprot:4116211-Pyramimonas_sp.AAC.1